MSSRSAINSDGPNADGLSDLERRFVEAYVVSLHGKDAAIKAGYAPGSAKVTACRLLKKPRIRLTIDNWRKESASSARISLDEAKAILSEIARGQITDYLNEDWSLKIHGCPHPTAIRSVEITEFQTRNGRTKRVTRIRLHDPVAAIARLAALNGWDRPQQVNVTGGILDQILALVDGTTRGVIAARPSRGWEAV